MGCYYDFPHEIDPAATEITVEEEAVYSEDGARRTKELVVLPRLSHHDLPPTLTLSAKLFDMHCFGEVHSDSRQVFFVYDKMGQPRSLYSYRRDTWQRQRIGKLEEQPFGVLLRFKSTWS